MNSKKESLWGKVSTFLVFAGPATFAFLAVVIVPFLYGVYCSKHKAIEVGRHSTVILGIISHICLLSFTILGDNVITTLLLYLCTLSLWNVLPNFTLKADSIIKNDMFIVYSIHEGIIIVMLAVLNKGNVHFGKYSSLIFVILLETVLIVTIGFCLNLIISRLPTVFNIIFTGGRNEHHNIELLRILCMMSLVAHHFTIHGNLYLNENIFVQRFSLIFAPLGKMCYVVFMVISSYFLSNAKVKSKRFWKVWMEVLFYNILMMLATLVGSGWNGLLSIKMIAGSILPMLGASHGYAVAYLWFLAFLPFIKTLQEKMNERFLGNLIFLLFSLEIVSWIIGSFIDYNAGIKSELFFFVLIYYSTLCLKKYDEKLLHVSRKTLFSWGGMRLHLFNRIFNLVYWHTKQQPYISNIAYVH